MEEREKYIKLLIQEIVMRSRHDGWSLEWCTNKLKELTQTQSSQHLKNNQNDNENQKPN